MLLFLARLFTGIIFLALAALRDWRTREVPDGLWALMGMAGLLLLTAEIYTSSASAEAYLVLIPIGLLLLDLLWDRQDEGTGRTATLSLYAAALGTIAVLLLRFTALDETAQAIVRRAFGTLFVFLFSYLSYYLRVIKGGADAKALISIAMLAPGYPSLDGLPMLALRPEVLPPFEVFFPAAMSILMTSALLLLFLPLLFLLRNLAAGHFRWPQALLGYKVPIDSIPRHVWVLQDMEEGAVRYHIVPRLGPEEVNLDGLRSLGIHDVWVTPKIPFLLPMAVAYPLTLLLGNPLFALF